jgi:molecular chaperone GrpE
MMPSWDQLERARDHGDLPAPIAAIVSQLDEALERIGFVRFGQSGEEFDPNRHEAVMHRDDAAVDKVQVDQVFDSGYLNGEKVIRPAKVSTVGPA